MRGPQRPEPVLKAIGEYMLRDAPEDRLLHLLVSILARHA